MILATNILFYYEILKAIRKMKSFGSFFYFVSLNVVMNIDEHIHNLISMGLIGK